MRRFVTPVSTLATLLASPLLVGLLASPAHADCRKDCKQGETRDAAGCCVPGGARAKTTPRTPTGRQQPPSRSKAATVDGGPAQLDWVVIPRATFTMGALKGQETSRDETPARKVTVDGFAMARTETTVAQYARCVDANECTVPGPCSSTLHVPTYGAAGMVSHPVNCITWFQARDFCVWAGGRLPTEAEWEYAARGTDTRMLPWGNDWPGTTPARVGNLADATLLRDDPRATLIQNYDDGYAETAPVGRFPEGRSPFGLDDMAGNVEEWVNDWYELYDAEAPLTNPRGPAEGKKRVHRGGWFAAALAYMYKTTRRSGSDPNYAGDSIGVRCARDL